MIIKPFPPFPPMEQEEYKKSIGNNREYHIGACERNICGSLQEKWTGFRDHSG